MLVPREYQEDAVNALWGYFASGKRGNPLVLMPTGTGKSVVIALFLMRALLAYPNTRAMMLTHVETLISQNFAKLLDVWPTAPAGINSAALGRRDVKDPIVFAGIQSVYKMAAAFGYLDFLIIDEAHLVGTKDETMYQFFINELKKVNPRLKVIGLTATAWRLGLGSLLNGNIFTDIAIDMTTPEAWDWFVDMGYLSPLLSKRTQLRLDDSKLKVVGGEYTDASQQQELDKVDLNLKACTEMLYWGDLENRNMWMVFATGVAHCEHVAEQLNDLGVHAVAIHSKSKNPRDLIQDYKDGAYRAAVSMNKLTTGVDAPGIDLIGVLRFTNSSAMWIQMLGRGTRPLYGDPIEMEKDPHSQVWRMAAIQAGDKANGCRVCDFAHNTERLGPVNNPVISEPKGKSGKKRKAGPVPVRVCPECSEYVHHSKQFCKCGYDFGFTARIHGEGSDFDVMTRALPLPEMKVDVIEVSHVTYSYFKRRNDAQPMLRVSYYTDNILTKPVSEMLCFEHTTGAQKYAARWWVERVPIEGRGYMPVPATVADAMKQIDWLRKPKRIGVWVNSKFPKVVNYEFE